MVKHASFHYEWDQMDGEIKIRSYWEGDRQEVFRIAADTAFFGAPVEAFLDDRRLFCDAFVKYYLDFEADYVWVACIDDQVVGYLTGCVDSAVQRKRHLIRTIAPLVGRVFQGKYKLGSKTWRFTRSMFRSVMRNEYPHVNYDKYPAHLHMNVDAAKRGQGLGQKLMEAYLNQIRQLGIPGVFLGTTNLNEAACRLYEKTGFKLLEICQTQVWSYLVGSSVENRIYGFKLIDRDL
jgi:GNAT superfamily N-acetyltransferase